MVPGKMTEAHTPTIWLGTTPSGLTSYPPPSSPSMYINYYYNYIHLTAFSQDNLGKPAPER